MPDYTEVYAAQQSRPGLLTPEQRAHHRQIQQVVILRMEQLLHSTEWETFVEHVRALMTVETALVESYRAQLEDSGLVGDELQRIALGLRLSRARLNAWQQALDLPAAVKTQAEAVPIA